MCKAPKPPKVKEPKKPQFLRNKYLDSFIGDSAAVTALRTGRSSLRIPQGSPTPESGRQIGESLVSQPTSVVPSRTSGGNANTPPSGGDFRPIRGRQRTNPTR